MFDDISIQQLFAQLRREHLLVYLRAKGWLDVPGGVIGDRVRYELANGENPFVVYLPRSGRTAPSRRLLQAAIYNLSGVEDRQPRETIIEMLAMEGTEEPAEAGEPRGVRLRLANNDPKHSMTLEISTRSGETPLMPGEAVEFVVNPPNGKLVEVAVQKVDP